MKVEIWDLDPARYSQKCIAQNSGQVINFQPELWDYLFLPTSSSMEILNSAQAGYAVPHHITSIKILACQNLYTSNAVWDIHCPGTYYLSHTTASSVMHAGQRNPIDFSVTARKIRWHSSQPWIPNSFDNKLYIKVVYFKKKKHLL